MRVDPFGESRGGARRGGFGGMRWWILLLFAGYAAWSWFGGAKVDPVRAHWWEVFGTVRWGIICHTQAWKHLSGSLQSMEMASIGRRAVETEVDLLQLLKEAR